MSSTGIDVDDYFRKNLVALMGLGLAVTAMYVIMATNNHGILVLQMYWIVTMPTLYMILCLLLGRTYWVIPTDIWIAGAVLGVMVWAPIDFAEGYYSFHNGTNGLTMRDNDNHEYDFSAGIAACVCLDIVAFAFLVAAIRWSSARRETGTLRLFVVLYVLEIARSFHRLGITILKLRLDLEGPLDLVECAISLLIATIVALLMLSRSLQERKLLKRKERIFRTSLKQRPPGPFPKSEFMILWRSRCAKGTEEELLEAVVDAVEWCFERPARYWSYLEENIFNLAIWENPEVFYRLQELARQKKAEYEALMMPIVQRLREEDRLLEDRRLAARSLIDRTCDTRSLRNHTRGITATGEGNTIFTTVVKSGGAAASAAGAAADDGDGNNGSDGNGGGGESEMRLQALGQTMSSLLEAKPDAKFESHVDEILLPLILKHFAESAFDAFREALMTALPRAVIQGSAGTADATIQIQIQRRTCVKSVPRMQQKVRGVYEYSAALVRTRTVAHDIAWSDYSPYYNRISIHAQIHAHAISVCSPTCTHRWQSTGVSTCTSGERG
jgi:hypothetical protein